MLYFGLYVQLRRGSVAGYTTDESWAYGPKEGVEAFESITFFIRFIYAINFEHLLILKDVYLTTILRTIVPLFITTILPNGLLVSTPSSMKKRREAEVSERTEERPVA